jgi:hypothetical protein
VRAAPRSPPPRRRPCLPLQSEREALQWVAYEKQQKEIEKNQDLIRRLSGGAQSGRAAGAVRATCCPAAPAPSRLCSHVDADLCSRATPAQTPAPPPPPPPPAAEKQIERIKAEGLIEKPFVPKRRTFHFPPVEKMGQSVVKVEGLTHGYGGRLLFKGANLEIERGDRVAIIGPNGCGWRVPWGGGGGNGGVQPAAVRGRPGRLPLPATPRLTPPRSSPPPCTPPQRRQVDAAAADHGAREAAVGARRAGRAQHCPQLFRAEPGRGAGPGAHRAGHAHPGRARRAGGGGARGGGSMGGQRGRRRRGGGLGWAARAAAPPIGPPPPLPAPAPRSSTS